MFHHLLIDGGQQIWFAVSVVIFLGITISGWLMLERHDDAIFITVVGLIIALFIAGGGGLATARTHYWTVQAEHQLSAQGFDSIWELNVTAAQVGITAHNCSLLVSLHTNDATFYPVVMLGKDRKVHQRITPQKLEALCKVK